MRRTALFEMLTMSASSCTFSRRSSSTALWNFFIVSGVVTSFVRPQRCLSSTTAMLNSCRRAASPLVRLVEGVEWWEAPDSHSQGVLPLNWGGAELNRTVTCIMLKVTANDRRICSPLP
ncbi:hypothetical protein TNCV_1541971 [Trichonephila clavipes]|nr:hypothetical protein TNCV_1541971 [Trichonephila clavipes]